MRRDNTLLSQELFPSILREYPSHMIRLEKCTNVVSNMECNSELQDNQLQFDDSILEHFLILR